MDDIKGPLDGLNAEALRLIKEVAQWKWHPGAYGFVDQFGVADPKRITRAELVERHLYDDASPADRAAGIAWLRERLGVRQATGSGA
jgi:hypothetical protein